MAEYMAHRESERERAREREASKSNKDKGAKKEKCIAKDANDVNSIEKYGIECAFTQNPQSTYPHKMASLQRSEKRKSKKKKNQRTHTHRERESEQKKPLQYNQRSIRNIPSKEIM